MTYLKKEDPDIFVVYTTLLKNLDIMKKGIAQQKYTKHRNIRDYMNLVKSVVINKIMRGQNHLLQKTKEENNDFQNIAEIAIILQNLSMIQKNIFVFNLLFTFDSHTIKQLLGLQECYVSRQLYVVKAKLKNTNTALWRKAMALHLHVEHYGEARWNILFFELVTVFKELQDRFKNDTGDIVNRPGFYCSVVLLKVRKYLALIGICLVSSYSLAQGFQSLFNRIAYEKYDELRVISEGKSLEFVETLYFPEYLPQGYRLEERFGKLYIDNIIHATFTNNNNVITFEYATTIYIHTIDNEDPYQKQALKINGMEGFYYYNESPVADKAITWSDGIYFYSLRGIDLGLTKEEMIKIAESIEEK